ncbi:MAG: hypothetical protein QM760_07455 [Nibricoccus sp.]
MNMNKTPDQIYDDFESRRTEIHVQKKKKFRSRLGDLVGLAIPLVTFAIWSLATKLNPIAFAVGFTYLGFALSELMKRWALEDRIERLEEKK